MADRRKNERTSRRGGAGAKNALMTVLLAVLAASLFVYLNDNYLHIDYMPSGREIMQTVGVISAPTTASEGEAAVHYIDVGQGDCQLITVGNSNVLIDCGEEDRYEYVKAYLDDLGIMRLDYVIATHPHSDHIGGMYRVLADFDIGHFIMPRTADNMVPSTKYYERMLDAIEERGISASYAKAGEVIQLDGGAQLEIIAPLHDDYDNLNNYSVVMRLIFGNTSFLFTGDAERAAESDILNSGADISCDVIKIGHHGSTSSSTEAFLKAASPKYAVIFVGEDNAYGHPKQEVTDRLKNMGCEYYLTMTYGNIVFISDGEELKLYSSKKGEVAA